MKREIAQAALQFMNRVQLQGAEVQAWQAVCQALQEEATREIENDADSESEGRVQIRGTG